MNNYAVALTKCFFCHQGSTIVLPRMLTPRVASQIEAMHNKVVDYEPCQECAGHMAAGIILVSIRDDEPVPASEEMPNPYRTGGWCVIREEAAVRIFSELIKSDDRAIVDAMVAKRFMFVEDKVWDAIGLPRGPLPDT